MVYTVQSKFIKKKNANVIKKIRFQIPERKKDSQHQLVLMIADFEVNFGKIARGSKGLFFLNCAEGLNDS